MIRFLFILLPLLGLLNLAQGQNNGVLSNTNGTTLIGAGAGPAGPTGATGPAGPAGPAGGAGSGTTVTNSWQTNLVINTTAETSLFNAIVLASTLGTNSDLWVHVGGYYTNNSGSASGLTFTIKYGATTIYAGSVGQTITASANARPVWIDLHCQNTGSTGQQYLSGYIGIGSLNATTGLGIGPGINTVFLTYPIGGFCAVDSTAQQTFDVRVTHGTQAASIGIASVASFARIQ